MEALFMRRCSLIVLLLVLLANSRASAQTVETLTVTAQPIAVKATSAGFFAMLYEQVQAPSAAFEVTPLALNGSQLPIVNVAVGAAYVFSRRGQPAFNPGDTLGYVQATTPGPYTFVLVQYPNASNAPQVTAVKCPLGQYVGEINPDGTSGCTNESPVTTWNPYENAVVFTAPGTWSAPVVFTNSNPLAQSVNAATEFMENTDGQFEIVTFSNGQQKALLNLDTDGHIDLYGDSGGGISTDLKGNTCLAGNNGACTNVVFSEDGPLSNYRGVALKAGDGMPVILYGGTGPFTGNFGPYTLYTTPATGYTSTGLFRVSGYLVETSAVAGATMQVAINYVDASGANEQDSGAPISFATVGSKLPFAFVLQSIPSQSISITLSTANSPSYTFYVAIEAL
jgi:hypothetical protein